MFIIWSELGKTPTPKDSIEACHMKEFYETIFQKETYGLAHVWEGDL